MKTVRTPVAEVKNNTKFEIVEILQQPVLHHYKSNWRQRDVTLFEHPEDNTRVLSIGITFCGSKMIVCDDPKTSFEYELTHKPKETN